MTPISDNPPLIRLKNVTFGYRRHPAVHHLSGTFGAGDYVALVGPNGAGKSTLLRGIMGLLPTLSGEVERLLPMHEIGYLAQYAEREESFPLSVQEAVVMGHWHRISWHGSITKTLWQQAHAAIAKVGLQGFEKRHVASLSRGQFQRMLFARLLTQDPALILLDEPFNAMDQRTTTDLLALMADWHLQKRTIIVVLHDFEQVRRHIPSCLLLGRQVIGWGATSEVLTTSNIETAQSMCEAWEEGAAVCRLPGETP
ncbi:MAG: ABC transporter ATP-binding protein [Magnetococcales bacterium]|nr:ABC transporter ATP-binding protein [Magnetococcales bacterium]NGZ25723.1 ABC transporter ATP-binding protein [Magnetococcales bacterium]